METQAKTEDVGRFYPPAGNVGNRNAAVSNVCELPPIKACPECGSIALVFGSRDPCEGDAYWCEKCDCGPIWFPLNHSEDIGTVLLREKAVSEVRNTRIRCRPIIDAEQANEALRLVADLKRVKTHEAILSIQRAHGLVGRS